MAQVKFKLPDVGEGVVEAEIVEWHVKAGDPVAEDQTLVAVMTDKATVEIPSPVAGRIVSTVGEPGDIVNVGSEIIVFETDADVDLDAAAAEPKPAEPEAKAPPKESAPASKKDASKDNVVAFEAPKPAARPSPDGAPARPVAAAAAGGKPLASPAVRKRAMEADLDLALVPGTGPAGRVTHEDLDDFLAAGGRLVARAGAAVAARAPRMGAHEEKVIGLRRKIAENMSRSAFTIPHIMYAEEIDVTALEALRKHLNATRREDQPKLTLLPFIMLAMAKALPEFPQANAHYDPDAGVLTKYDAVHIGIATATDSGLMVPVVRHVEAKDAFECAAELARLSKAAREGKATKEELTGSTITITSLGAIGGIVTTPIINHPETAIIGVNKMAERPAFDAEGRVVPRLFMNLSSSFDHRIVDGWECAQLIQRIKGMLEQPATIFM